MLSSSIVGYDTINVFHILTDFVLVTSSSIVLVVDDVEILLGRNLFRMEEGQFPEPVAVNQNQGLTARSKMGWVLFLKLLGKAGRWWRWGSLNIMINLAINDITYATTL